MFIFVSPFAHIFKTQNSSRVNHQVTLDDPLIEAKF